MAGFDFSIPITSNERPLAKLLLSKLQQSASKLGVALRFRWNGSPGSVSHYHYYVTVDGGFPDIQILLKQTNRYIQGYSDGYVAASPNIKSSRIGGSIVISLSSAIFDFQDELQDLFANLNKQISPNLPITFNSFIFDFPDESGLLKSGASLTGALLGTILIRYRPSSL